jgi:hypothetical protein
VESGLGGVQVGMEGWHEQVEGHDGGAVFTSCTTRVGDGPSGSDMGLGVAVWERMSCGLCFASVFSARQKE